jgi:hypothetical protein
MASYLDECDRSDEPDEPLIDNFGGHFLDY